MVETKRQTTPGGKVMNTQKKFAKLFGSLGIVVLATLVLVSGIAAAPMLAHRTTRIRYEQYVAASIYEAPVELAGSVPASLVTMVRFGQYREALEQMEADRAAVIVESADDTESLTSIRFEQYLWASQQ
jgi:hypothetical protein